MTNDIEAIGGDHRPVTDYLRISVTDRCNLRCIYCMPKEGVTSVRHEDILSYEELARFAGAAVGAGISKVRITGGEPLVRKGVAGFVRLLREKEPGLKISMTTNGLLLARHASDLKEAGLSRVNVSIDSLEPGTYRKITRVGNVKDAMAGLQAAIDQGLSPVKVNVVTLRGINEDPLPFARLTRELPVHVRFIEYMPYFGETGKWFVSSDETRARIEEAGELEEVESPEGWGPATYFRLKGAPGTIGFISTVSCHFCPACNRIRISAEGKMRTCLFERDGVDMRELIRENASEEELREIIEQNLERKHREGDHKPKRGQHYRVSDHMSRIGG